MIKYCVQKWDKYKGDLEKDIRTNFQDYLGYNYKNFVEKVTEFIFKDSEGWRSYDDTNITEIDNGDYQGTLLYMIPLDTYQPSETEYLLTHVSYGSCSGCDTLQAIQYDYEDDKEQQIKDFMTLCLHIVQNTIKPFNYEYGDNDYATIDEEG